MTNKSPVWFGIEPQNIETPKIDQDRKIRNLKLKGNIYSIYIYIHLYTQEHFSTSRVAMQNIQFGMPDCRPSDKHSQFLTCQTIVFLSKIQYFVRIVKICFFLVKSPCLLLKFPSFLGENHVLKNIRRGAVEASTSPWVLRQRRAKRSSEPTKRHLRGEKLLMQRGYHCDTTMDLWYNYSM